MTDHEELLTRLTDKDAKSACAYAEKLAAESRESDRYVPYLDDFTALLHHKNLLVRNRAISILATNARWDSENRYDALMDEFLSHVTDEKPITARQCIQGLPEIAAAVFAASGLGTAAGKPSLIPSDWVLWGGIATYVLLLIVTRFLLHRPVTTELLLIVGWAMLALSETSALFGCSALGRGTAMAFSALIAVGAVVSLVCYVLYYKLPAKAGFIDGIVPLATAVLIMAGMDLTLLAALG